jgi:DNA-binding FadR family transcriptional regulator
MPNNTGRVAAELLREYIGGRDYPLNSRLPPERKLCIELGVNRTALRNGLAALEAEGQIWRHVGKGTFVGNRPVENGADIAAVTSRSSPAEVMEARLVMEPELARMAALHATADDVSEMRHCIRKTEAARKWHIYEMWDNRLHRTIAKASRNICLLAIFDMLNSVRRAVAWGRLRTYELTPDLAHHSFAEHSALVDAIAERDVDQAAKRMRDHLRAVRRDLLRSVDGIG